MSNFTIIAKPYANSQDLTKQTDIEPKGMIRLYKSSPDAMTLQVRSYGSTADRRGGVKRHIVSSAELTRDEAITLSNALGRFIAREI